MDSIYSKIDQEKIKQIKQKLSFIDLREDDPEAALLTRSNFVKLVKKKKTLSEPSKKANKHNDKSLLS